ncbi:MAG: ArnT family glycosyltransferase [Isosphaeraceae bacterium]
MIQADALLRHHSRLVLAVALLAVALRGGVMVAGSDSFDDPDNYLPLARSISEGKGLVWNGRPTAYRPPLYPSLLAPLVQWSGPRPLFAIAVFHLALAAGTVWMTASAARKWGLSDWRILIAAAIVACDPVLLWQSRFVMTETLGAFLTALALAELADPRWRGAVAGGASLGLASLCRPSLLPGAGLVVLGCLPVGSGTRRQRLLRGLALALSMIAVLTPWAIRNALVLGEPIITTTHGGYTLALANNEPYYRDVLAGSSGRVWTGKDQFLWWDSVTQATAGMSEPEADRFLRQTVIRLAVKQPATFLRACVDRLNRFWSVAPAVAVYSPVIRLATAIWTIPLWMALAIGLLRREQWSWPRIAAPLAIVGLSLVHTLYWTDIRMRAPIVPAIALVAASAVLPIWSGRTRTAYETTAGS